LQASPLHAPVLIESADAGGQPTADLYAVLDRPLAELQAALNSPQRWCELMLLHISTLKCQVAMADQAPLLQLAVGRSYDQPLEQANHLALRYLPVANSPEYLEWQLQAESGPMGTSHHLVLVQVLALDAGHSFVHLHTSYRMGLLTRMALQAYMATVGSAKVGFTATSRNAAGDPVYIGGARGIVERNAMRYFLALQAILATQTLPASERDEQRLLYWYAASERYPRQLHEIDQATYLATKRLQLKR